MTRAPPRRLPVPVITGKRMLRVSWSQWLVVATLVLHGSPAGAQLASADAANDAGMPVAPGGNPVAQIPLDKLSATRNRPLFSPSRRAPALSVQPDRPTVARVEHAQPAPPPPGIALFGIVVGAQGARAFITAQPADRIVGVRPGDDVSGWTVTAITERRLVLSRADRSATFTLFSEANGSQIQRSDAVTSSRLENHAADPPPRRRVRVQ
jgi:general secretion pathway protein N